eukprot:m.235365 g.235365  ORF g.235365 m.235365 type:complete len:62 (-) comp17402_c0_seq6:58-243(-)
MMTTELLNEHLILHAKDSVQLYTDEYAVEIFQVTGRHCHVVLPVCVVYAVRRLWPTKAGVP